MKISAEAHDPRGLRVDLLVVPVPAGEKKFSGAAASLDKATGGLLADLKEQEAFTGKEGETATLRTMGKLAAAKIMLLGMGPKALRASSARKLAARAVRASRDERAKTIALVLPERLADAATEIGQAMAEGATLGDYRFLKYKDEELKKYAERAPQSFALAAPKRLTGGLEKGIARGLSYSHATILARGLVNEPASEMTPGKLADIARALAAAHPKRLKLEIHDTAKLKAMKAGGLLAVAQGSDEPAYLIHLTYRPAPGNKRLAKRRVAVVGKGITFDSGGLSLKSASHMEDMKIDMAGCAAMLGVMGALAELAPDVEVHGISGVCENMPSGKAMRPGDVVRTMSGKTIEILNTDAEGRVTLADTLHYAAQLKPDAMIDLATLTGACMVALGQEVAGMMTNSRKLAAKLLAAAEEAGEMLWELPLVDEYRPLMKSHVADFKNISGSSYGGAITAGTFLEEFVGNVPWAHLDIAGPAWAEKDTVPHQPRGATGFGVRTVLRWIESF
jgi:leucyl aminopeptidase